MDKEKTIQILLEVISEYQINLEHEQNLKDVYYTLYRDGLDTIGKLETERDKYKSMMESMRKDIPLDKILRKQTYKDETTHKKTA